MYLILIDCYIKSVVGVEKNEKVYVVFFFVWECFSLELIVFYWFDKLGIKVFISKNDIKRNCY